MQAAHKCVRKTSYISYLASISCLLCSSPGFSFLVFSCSERRGTAKRVGIDRKDTAPTDLDKCIAELNINDTKDMATL